MDEDESVWYRIGYGLERARELPSAGARLKGLSERSPEPGRSTGKVDRETERRPAPAGEGDSSAAWEAVLATLAAALGSRVLGLVPSHRSPGMLRLLRAGAAGALAGALREVVRPLVTGVTPARPVRDAVEEAAVAGTARGLLYGALVEPRLPGTPLVRGAVFGGMEYLASPYGGLTKLAGARAPHRNVPVLAALFEDLGPDEDTLADHVVFGVALGLLYGGD